MRNLQFSLHRIKRAIIVQGAEYQVLRDQVDEFNEPTGSNTQVARIRGLWHTSNEYTVAKGQESSTIRSKENPRILTVWESATGIEQGDFITVGTTRYNVTGVTNVGELGIAAEVSLEAVI